MPRLPLRAFPVAVLLAAATNVPLAWALWPRHSPQFASMFVLGGLGHQDSGPVHDRIVSLALEPSRMMQITHRQGPSFQQWDMTGHFIGYGGPPRPSPCTPAEAAALASDPAAHLPPEVPLTGRAPAATMAWPRWARSIPAADTRITAFSIAASGWPLPALAAHSWVAEGASSRELRGGLRLSTTRPWTDGALPLTPIWPGFAFNTAAFTPAWLALILAPAAIRRALRRRASRCTSCGYDLRGQASPGCPECGWGRQTTPTQA